MCEVMIENDVARWEMRQLERKAAWLYRVKHMKGKGTRRLVPWLSAFGSRTLLNLGCALIAYGEKLRAKETSSTATAA